MDELKEVAKSLRKLPVVDPELPTVSMAHGDSTAVEAWGGWCLKSAGGLPAACHQAQQCPS